MAKFADFRCFFAVVIFLILIADLVHTREFHYKHYSFRKKQRQAKKYNYLEKDCEEQSCRHLSGVEQVRCARKCVSPSCYKELYGWNELEEGEIDVRLNSYKGCVVVELQNKGE